MPCDFNLFEGILSELAARKACHWDRFPPFYIISIGAHLFNVRNKGLSADVFCANGMKADTRLHVMMCAPPGGEKTFWQVQFLRGEQAILKDTMIDIGWMGTITEAGFVGTIKLIDGAVKTSPGMCQLHPIGIIGAEEMSAITESMKTEYARTLEPAMLSALDSGHVSKQLAAGPLDYETYLTLWGGTQPARYDLRGGMGRRFLMIHFVPTTKDWRDITLAMRNGLNQKFNPPNTDYIRREIVKLKEKISRIEYISFDPPIFKLYDEMKCPPYEELLYNRMLIGYHIMQNKFDKELHLHLDPKITELLKKEAYYRDSISRGTEFAEVLMILREHNGKMSLFELKDELLAFGKDWIQSAKLLDELVRIHAIKRNSTADTIELSQHLRKDGI